MTPKERALEIYQKFSIYDWYEVDGYVRDDFKTLKNCINVVNECIYFVYNIDTSSSIETYISRQATLRYLNDVKTELNKL